VLKTSINSGVSAQLANQRPQVLKRIAVTENTIRVTAISKRVCTIRPILSPLSCVSEKKKKDDDYGNEDEPCEVDCGHGEGNDSTALLKYPMNHLQELELRIGD
jgi:hypothetical protein